MTTGKHIDFRAEPTAANAARPEVKLKASTVSRGIAIGTVVCIHGLDRQYFKYHLDPDEIEGEVARLASAVSSASKKLEYLVTNEQNNALMSSQGIFEAHLMILRDSSFTSKIEQTLRSEAINAEWAVKRISDEYVAKYRSIADEHLRERYIDIEDVAERLLTSLSGDKSATPGIVEGSIIVAKELRPSTIVELEGRKPLAIVTEHGGWTSHTFILARELGIPAVTGLRNVLRRTDTGDRMIVDGYRGVLILNPTSETERGYEAARHERSKFPSTEPVEDEGPHKTLDGRKITISVNADNPSTLEHAFRAGAVGVGLFRSEYLFNRIGSFPSQAAQFEAYSRMAAATGDGDVNIRTFDIGISQVVDRNEDRERNPALGLRAVRLGLTYTRELKTQLRAILQASYKKQISVVIPMVTSLTDIRRFVEILKNEREALSRDRIDVGDPPIGAMIEVPAAVSLVDKILEEVDFLCLGTNDLIQYYLAADRDNETVAAWYQTLHPAVLQAIRSVILAAHDAEKPLIVCGEMAGSPFYAPLLVGLGATHLSMNANVIGRVRTMIKGIAYEETRALVKSIEGASTAEEVEEIVTDSIQNKWSHLLPDDLVPDPKVFVRTKYQ